MAPRTLGNLAQLDPSDAPELAPPPSRPHLYVASAEKIDDDSFLGQFIPIHYHYQMLTQEPRIGGFEQAIAAVVQPGMKVLELGAGTGVLSFFAARAGASKVWAVERIPHVAKAARRFLARHGLDVPRRRKDNVSVCERRDVAVPLHLRYRRALHEQPRPVPAALTLSAMIDLRTHPVRRSACERRVPSPGTRTPPDRAS